MASERLEETVAESNILVIPLSRCRFALLKIPADITPTEYEVMRSLLDCLRGGLFGDGGPQPQETVALAERGKDGNK